MLRQQIVWFAGFVLSGSPSFKNSFTCSHARTILQLRALCSLLLAHVAQSDDVFDPSLVAFLTRPETLALPRRRQRGLIPSCIVVLRRYLPNKNHATRTMASAGVPLLKPPKTIGVTPMVSFVAHVPVVPVVVVVVAAVFMPIRH